MVAVDTPEMVVEEEQEELHPLVHTVLQLVDRVDKPTTLIREDLVETPLVVTSTYLAVVVKCLTVTTEKVVVDHHSGIKQDLHTITITTKKRLPMVSGDLVEVMVTIHKTVLHIITVTVVQAVLSFSTTPKDYEFRTNQQKQ